MFALLSLLLAGCTDVAVSKVPVDADNDGFDSTVDCDDGHATVNPDAPEVCDDLDNDCDTVVDEDPTDGETWYADSDGDAAGDPDTAVLACDAPAGHVADDTDCDDGDASVHPGATELCNAVDDDCDGAIDEDPADATDWYADVDGDGFGDGGAERACEAPADHVADNTDCDDTNDAIHPGADEPDCTDPTDYDCDGVVAWADADGDGAAACEDCDDTDAAVSPGATETCDGADDDCDGSVDEGFDADGDTLADCFDTEMCDGVDNDGDGWVDDDDPDVTGTSTWYADADGDGYGDPDTTTVSCTLPAAHVTDATDCDDSESTTYPGADETCDDGVDSDCDGHDAAPCRYSGEYLLEGTTDAAVTLFGEASLDQFGYGLAGGMDLDGDGLGDLVVGAYGFDDGAYYGAAYAYVGAPAAGSARADTHAEAIVSGTPYSSYAFAADLFPLPDIDADGYDEWAAVHYNASPAAIALYLFEGESTTGALVAATDALVVETATGAFPAGNFSGADGGWWLAHSWDTSFRGAVTLYDGTTAGDQLLGEADDDIAGTWVAGGDDYDGDGISDVAIGAPRHDGGVVYVVLGPARGDLSLAAADSRIDATGTSDDFGRDLDAVGDIDGDGLADLLVGAPDANLSAGAVYLFTGVDPTRARPDDAAADAATVFAGDTGEELSGEENQSLSLTGDIDADGQADFLLSSARATVGGAASAGRAWLLYGPRTGAVDVSADADAWFDGDEASDACGSDGALADLDGDGWLDIVLGCARGEGAAGTDVGAVYVYYGG